MQYLWCIYTPYNFGTKCAEHKKDYGMLKSSFFVFVQKSVFHSKSSDLLIYPRNDNYVQYNSVVQTTNQPVK